MGPGAHAFQFVVPRQTPPIFFVLAHSGFGAIACRAMVHCTDPTQNVRREALARCTFCGAKKRGNHSGYCTRSGGPARTTTEMSLITFNAFQTLTTPPWIFRGGVCVLISFMLNYTFNSIQLNSIISWLWWFRVVHPRRWYHGVLGVGVDVNGRRMNLPGTQGPLVQRKGGRKRKRLPEPAAPVFLIGVEPKAMGGPEAVPVSLPAAPRAVPIFVQAAKALEFSTRLRAILASADPGARNHKIKLIKERLTTKRRESLLAAAGMTPDKFETLFLSLESEFGTVAVEPCHRTAAVPPSVLGKRWARRTERGQRLSVVRATPLIDTGVIKSFRPAGDALFLQKPGSSVTCDVCDKVVPYTAGTMKGESGQPWSARCEFLSHDCNARSL